VALDYRDRCFVMRSRTISLITILCRFGASVGSSLATHPSGCLIRLRIRSPAIELYNIALSARTVQPATHWRCPNAADFPSTELAAPRDDLAFCSTFSPCIVKKTFRSEAVMPRPLSVILICRWRNRYPLQRLASPSSRYLQGVDHVLPNDRSFTPEVCKADAGDRGRHARLLSGLISVQLHLLPDSLVRRPLFSKKRAASSSAMIADRRRATFGLSSQGRVVIDSQEQLRSVGSNCASGRPLGPGGALALTLWSSFIATRASEEPAHGAMSG